MAFGGVFSGFRPAFDAGGARNGLLNALIAYWPLNEANGNALDLHTNGLTLTDTNTVTSNPGKVYTLARQYTAANTEYHTRNSESLLQTGDVDFSVAAWVYLDSKTAARIIAAKDNGLTLVPGREFLLTYSAAADRFRFAVWTAPATQITVTGDVLGSPSTGAWYLVIGWHDSVANMAYLQISNGNADSAATGASLQVASTAAFRIGAQDTVTPSLMDGRIGPAMFWKSAAGGGGVLTAVQRTALYNGGAGLAYAAFTA